MNGPNLEGLSTFVLVADSGSMSAAAKILQLTVNAVSNRIMMLEERLEVRLFHRTTRRLSLTDEGRVLLERSRLVLGELEGILSGLRSKEKDAISGTVRIGLSSGALSEYVFVHLSRCLEANPKLQIQVQPLREASEVVAKGLDVGILPGPIVDSGLSSRKIGTVQWHLCASPSYLKKAGTPKTPHDLTRHRCLRFLANPPQSQWTLFDRRGTQLVVQVGGQFESDDSRILGDAVYAGAGIGVRPAIELKSAAKIKKLVRVLPDYTFEPLEVRAVFSPGRSKLARVEVVLKALTDALSSIA